jgi:hypothetical protein
MAFFLRRDAGYGETPLPRPAMTVTGWVEFAIQGAPPVAAGIRR